MFDTLKWPVLTFQLSSSPQCIAYLYFISSSRQSERERERREGGGEKKPAIFRLWHGVVSFLLVSGLQASSWGLGRTLCSTAWKMDNWIFGVILWTQLSNCSSTSSKQHTLGIELPFRLSTSSGDAYGCDVWLIQETENVFNSSVSAKSFWSSLIFVDLF